MPPRPTVIACSFLKGGSGKSLTAFSLASYLSTKFPTLAVDTDSQSTLSNALVETLPEVTAYELMKRQVDVDDAAAATSASYPENLFLVSGSARLAGLDAETAADVDRAYLLSDSLGNADFRFVVVDTPPTSGLQAIASLVAATHVVTPITCEPASWEQLPAFERLLAQIKKRLNLNLNWIGILPTRFDSRNKLDREILDDLRSRYGDQVLSPIRATVRLREVMVQGVPPWHQPSPDYFTFTNELLERIGHEEAIAPEDCISKGRQYER
jgi:chromosome partitioning protein